MKSQTTNNVTIGHYILGKHHSSISIHKHSSHLNHSKKANSQRKKARREGQPLLVYQISNNHYSKERDKEGLWNKIKRVETMKANIL